MLSQSLSAQSETWIKTTEHLELGMNLRKASLSLLSRNFIWAEFAFKTKSSAVQAAEGWKKGNFSRKCHLLSRLGDALPPGCPALWRLTVSKLTHLLLWSSNPSWSVDSHLWLLLTQRVILWAVESKIYNIFLFLSGSLYKCMCTHVLSY